MTEQPSRVTPGEISDLLDQMRQLDTITSPAAAITARLAYFERKADLLTRIADDLGTADSRDVAAHARAYATELRTVLSPDPLPGVTR